MAKAILIAATVAPPRTHDIEELGALVAQRDVEIGRTISELGELTTWFAAGRYPDTFQISLAVEDINSTLTRLRTLRERIDLLAPKV
jgi:HEPN domain-containing protein